MKHKISTEWVDGLTFNSEIGEHVIRMDAKEEVGGRNLGPNPKPLLLSALTGCTGMDVASLFKKMKLEVDEFSIEVEGELTEEHPQFYKSIKLIYHVTGKNIDKSKVKKAIDLSMDRYCGISYMLSKSSEITYELVLHQTEHA